MAGKANAGWVVDRDGEYIDNAIAINLDITERATWIMDASDNPDVVRAAADIIRSARYAQAMHRNYRPRLVQLRRIEKAGREAGGE